MRARPSVPRGLLYNRAMALSIYLAGPDVFLPDARRVGAEKVAICAELGFEGLFPLDADVTPDPSAIFAGNRELMLRADVGLFNLTPFRGPSADAGTTLELGFMAALGKPVYGYSGTAVEFRERVAARFGVARRDGRLWGGDGLAVEDFGLRDNLMVDGAIEAIGGDFVTLEGEGEEGGLAAFAAFRACLERVRARRRG